MIVTRKYALGTELTVSYPWSINIGGKALCSDGKVRKLKRIAQTADTFFSIPASVEVTGPIPNPEYWQTGNTQRKTVAGYITFSAVSGSSVETDGDPMVLKFIAYTYRKNGEMLP